MNLARPIRSVIPSLHGEVLAVLARADQPLTGRTVARLVGDSGSPAGVARVLKALVHEGLVRSTALGTASLYEFNHDHVAAEAVVALSGLRDLFVDRLREAVGRFRPQLARAYLFGSAARGDGDSSSDVDLLLVRRTRPRDDRRWDEAVVLLAERVRSWSGNSAGIVVYTEPEFAAASTGGDPVVAEVLAHGVLLR